MSKIKSKQKKEINIEYTGEQKMSQSQILNGSFNKIVFFLLIVIASHKLEESPPKHEFNVFFFSKISINIFLKI